MGLLPAFLPVSCLLHLREHRTHPGRSDHRCGRPRDPSSPHTSHRRRRSGRLYLQNSAETGRSLPAPPLPLSATAEPTCPRLPAGLPAGTSVPGVCPLPSHRSGPVKTCCSSGPLRPTPAVVSVGSTFSRDGEALLSLLSGSASSCSGVQGSPSPPKAPLLPTPSTAFAVHCTPSLPQILLRGDPSVSSPSRPRSPCPAQGPLHRCFPALMLLCHFALQPPSPTSGQVLRIDTRQMPRTEVGRRRGSAHI